MVVSPRRFEQIVGEALDALPRSLLDATENVAVVVEDRPSREQLASSDGGALLGLYEGVPLGERAPAMQGYLGMSPVMPDRITLFRLALCEMSTDEDDLYQNVYETLVHEFAHHFGIDDDRLDELGWT